MQTKCDISLNFSSLNFKSRVDTLSYPLVNSVYICIAALNTVYSSYCQTRYNWGGLVMPYPLLHLYMAGIFKANVYKAASLFLNLSVGESVRVGVNG